MEGDPRHEGRLVHVEQMRMRWGDMDAQGHVNNAAYLDYLQEARVHFLLTGPPAMQVARAMCAGSASMSGPAASLKKRA